MEEKLREQIKVVVEARQHSQLLADQRKSTKVKVIHPGYLISMTLRTIKGFLDSNLFSEAIDQQKEYRDNLTQEVIKEQRGDG